jgi:hypothetical protein
MHWSHRIRSQVGVVAMVITVACATSASGADQASPVPVPPSAPVDFLFGQPQKSIAVRGTWVVPREGGDLFGFFHDLLTIDKGAFKTAALNADLGVLVSPRLGLLIGFEESQASVDSEYRRLIGSDGLPIAQKTQLKGVSVYASLKVALISPGRRISRYAWIPKLVTPFVGAGGGIGRYSLEQKGEFVDFVDRSIFPETFTSKGWGPTGHAFGGADVRVWRNVYLTVEGRYVWAHGKLGSDFVDFDGIDLSGFRLGSGVILVF